MSESTYTVPMVCTNCNFEQLMPFAHGKRVPEKEMCPNCGCYTMVKKLIVRSSNLAEICDVFFNGREFKP